jgi:hypothetical protein
VTQHVEELLLRAREESLTEAERTSVDAHVATCTPCAALWNTLARNDALLSTRELPLPLPARRPARGHTSAIRLPLIPAGALAVIVVLALVVGASLSAHRAASPQPSPLPARSRYGLVVQSGGGPLVQAENDSTTIASLYAEPLHRGLAPLGVTGAVSPDGHRFAYWIPDVGPPGVGGLGPMRLALYDATTGSIRELLRLSSEMGNGVVWSTDGGALLFGVVWHAEGSAGDGLNAARVRTFELGTGQTSDVGPAMGGAPVAPPPGYVAPTNVSLRPLHWDRTSDQIVAVEASGNTNYANGVMVLKGGAISSEYALDGRFLNTIAISSDGTMLAGTQTSDFALVAWPIADYGARKEIVSAPGERIITFWWRPQSDELFFMHDNALSKGPPGSQWNRLEAWRPGTTEPSRVVDPAAPGSWIVFRIDGSAYFRTSFDPTAPTDLIETDSGKRLDTLPGQRVIVASLLLPAAAVHPTPQPSVPSVPIDRVPWQDGATDGWISPNTNYLVAKLPDGLGMYKVSGGAGSRRLILIKRLAVSADSGKWLEDSSGFVFDGLYGTTLDQRRVSGPLPITFELDVLETSGSVTHLQSNVLMYTAQFSYLSPDRATIAITGACCPSHVQLLPRSGGSVRDLAEAFFFIGWDNLGRVVYASTPDRIAARAPGSASDSFEITVPMPADSVLANVRNFSMSPDGTALLLQAGTTPASNQRYYVLVDGRLVDLPTNAPPTGIWIAGHELVMIPFGDKALQAFDPATGRTRQLPATFNEGFNVSRANGSFLLWQLRGVYRITDLETGAMRFVDLPPAEAVGGADFGVTEPGQFAIISKVGVTLIDANALMAQPAPSNLLRDRPTVGTTHVPFGLELPPLCRYVDFHDNLNSWDWQIDCGEGKNVRATIAVNLEHAGWSTCRTTTTESTWTRDDRELAVTDSPGPQQPMSMVESMRRACP